MRGNLDRCAVCRGHEHEVSVGRSSGFAGAVVLSHRACTLAQGKGFHIIQSMIAVSTGGITGVGLMEGKQKLFYLPEPHTDFIFAVTAEELGLWGSLLVVTLFGIFLYRGIRTALRTDDMF